MKVESLLQCNEFSDLSKFIKLYSVRYFINFSGKCFRLCISYNGQTIIK